MWLFLKSGFLSVVQHRSDPTLLVVRARTRRPLEWVRLQMREQGADVTELRIIDTPDADYPYRIELDRSDFAIVLSAYVRSTLDYTNFKNHVDDRARENLRDAGQTQHYAATLHRVWSVVFEMIDERTKRMSRARS